MQSTACYGKLHLSGLSPYEQSRTTSCRHVDDMFTIAYSLIEQPTLPRCRAHGQRGTGTRTSCARLAGHAAADRSRTRASPGPALRQESVQTTDSSQPLLL